jgi:hypothetical protein
MAALLVGAAFSFTFAMHLADLFIVRPTELINVTNSLTGFSIVYSSKKFFW